MTKEEMRIAIAEYHGFTDIRMSRRYECSNYPEKDYCGIRPGMSSETWRETIPDYPSNLDSMNEIELLIPADKLPEWEDNLSRVIHGEVGHKSRAMMMAKAAPRAEAFCRTLFPDKFK